MTAFVLPTLTGLARLLPIRVISDRPNVAGTAANTEYTVPQGRAAIITTMAIEQRGGVAYSLIGFSFRIAAAGNAGSILLDPPPANFRPLAWEGWLWLQETDDLLSVVNGGDATSDYRAVVFGAEFDWTDGT